MSPETQYLMTLVRGHLARTKDDERGVSAIEWVIIAVAIAGLALAVAAIIESQVRGKAGQLNLG